MKKFLILSVMILISFMAFGQTEETTTFQTTEQSVSQLTPDSAYSLVTRDANKYIANGEIMNKRAFMGFLKSRDAIAYKQFRTGYNLSLAGWVLLACGGVTMTVGLCGLGLNFGMLMVGFHLLEATGEDKDIENKTETFSWILLTGMATTVASVVCLGTGYGIMHNTPKIYNGNITKRKPVVTFNLQSSRDGLGIAMRF